MSMQSAAITQGITRPPVHFSFGITVATPAALEAIYEAGQEPVEFLSRHARLEQGELSTDDHQENLYSVDKDLRLLTAFKTTLGVKVWIITEADRSATTLLLPSEY